MNYFLPRSLQPCGWNRTAHGTRGTGTDAIRVPDEPLARLDSPEGTGCRGQKENRSDCHLDSWLGHTRHFGQFIGGRKCVKNSRQTRVKNPIQNKHMNLHGKYNINFGDLANGSVAGRRSTSSWAGHKRIACDIRPWETNPLTAMEGRRRARRGRRYRGSRASAANRQARVR